MLLLKDINVWLKGLDTKFENYYMGFLDNKKDKSLGVYNLKTPQAPIIAIGGLENTSYNVKMVSLLVHYTKASDETEEVATTLYEEIMNSKPTVIGKHEVHFIGMLTNGPVDVGRDDSGVCEYVIEFEIYYKRTKEV